MDLPNIFTKAVSDDIIERINKLTTSTSPEWGEMSVDQMLAHCNVTYEMMYDNIHPKPNPIMGFILKLMVKNKVVTDKPYPKNTPTAPQFIIKGYQDFSKEKARLIAYIQKTEQLGEDYFDQLASLSFGKLNKNEWNNMPYKHLNHHFTQFGV